LLCLTRKIRVLHSSTRAAAFSGASKEKSMKKLLLVAAAASALVACGKKEEAAPAPAAAPASAPAAVVAPEPAVLKVAIDPTYEPFTFKTADGKPTGFDVDVATALCEQIKRKCEFVEQVWDSMIPGLSAKKYDMIISSMSITEERLKEVDFTDKYYNTPSRIVLKKGVKFTDAASIKGKKIGVLKGSTQEKYALGELKAAGVVVNSYEAQDQVYLDIKSGRLDGTVADYLEVSGGFLTKPEGAKFELMGPELRDPKYFGTGVGVALRKGEDKLKGELNEAIKAIRTNGSYKTLNDKYFAKYNIDVYGE
jgi:arginine/ornithine transport system substrate-binding protein